MLRHSVTQIQGLQNKDHRNAAWTTWLSGLQNNGVSKIMHIHRDTGTLQEFPELPCGPMVVNPRKQISALETSGGHRADPHLEVSLNFSQWCTGPLGRRTAALCSALASCLPLPASHQWLLPSWFQTQNAKRLACVGQEPWMFTCICVHTFPGCTGKAVPFPTIPPPCL